MYVRNNSKKFSVVYPEEKEGRVKDANRKLKAQVRNLKKKIKQLESENKTIGRAYDKSCDFIQDKLSDKSLEEVLNMVKGHGYKETEKGREDKKKNPDEFEDFIVDKCPKCGTMDEERYTQFNLGKFKIESCACGYRRKAETSEGIERS